MLGQRPAAAVPWFLPPDRVPLRALDDGEAEAENRAVRTARGAGAGSSPDAVRPLTAGMRLLLLVGGGLGAIAGTQLFVGTEHTDRFFAWTIQSHMTAAFLGAMYYSAILLLVVSATERYWACARVAAFTLLSVATLVLIAVLAHLDLFHTDADRTLTMLGTWAFIGTYAVLPVALVAGIWRQLRFPGGDPTRLAPLPTWFRIGLAVQAAIMLSVGAALLIAPSATDALWSWELTPLTGRAVGAFVLSTGVASALGTRENDWTRIRGPIYSYATAAGLEFVALARYSDEVDWESITAWAYVGFLATALAVGVYGSLAATRSRPVTGNAIAEASA